MYHFTAENPPEPVRLSFRALIPGHIRQYLKGFQLEAIRFMHNFLVKGEFCVYNDESGLGKQAAVAVLLDAACSSKKCLIVVQNDDRYVNGWEFHFNVLTKVSVTIIKDAKDSTDSLHNIYIAKWSTLRTIDDLSKLKFDLIILDNRGQMLNNNFCTSMLLKHYERKINILVSSVDITSDLKLLHNILRLGGRLEPQYASFKLFEEKFKLPDVKELTYKRVDLEEYFCKRERLADYCKGFRLRRYCHQYESVLPLVKEDRYKINLEVWREKQNATNSESSSVEYINKQQQQHGDEHMKDTQELFEEYCRQRRKQHLKFQEEEEKRLQQREQEMLKNLQQEQEIIYNVDDEVALINEIPAAITEKHTITRENSDEPVLMSPLLVESESDTEDLPQICNDPNNDIEIVDLSSEEKNEQIENNRSCSQEILQTSENCGVVEDITNKESNNKTKTYKRKRLKKRSELDKLEEDIVDTLKLKATTKRLTRHVQEVQMKQSVKRLKDRMNEKVVNKIISSENSSNDKKLNVVKNSQINNKLQHKFLKTTAKQNKNKKGLTVVKENRTATLENTTHTCMIKSCKNIRNTSKNNKNNISKPPATLKKTKSENSVNIKKEVIDEISLAKHANSNDLSNRVNSEKFRFKRELEITPAGVHNKQTRSMQRLTRSAGGSNKYLTKNLSLQIDKIIKPRKKKTEKSVPKTTTAAIKNSKQLADGSKSKTWGNNTQVSVISHKNSQDYESIQCAQRFSDAEVFGSANEKTCEFLVPPTPPNTKNSLLPSLLASTAEFFTESDVVFVAPSNPSNTATKKREQIICLSSSDNENSTSQSSSTQLSMTSRRTRALKPRRVQKSTVRDSSKVTSFSALLAHQNTRPTSAKSPDLFSNCSDLVQLPCTQPPVESEEPNTPFEGFKIFGSEVKQLQQHYAFAKNNNTNKPTTNSKKSYRDQRSCLDILEKMFEPSNKKQKQPKETLMLTTPTKKSPRSGPRPPASILPSHPIEAITEARNLQELQHQQQTRKRSSLSSSIIQDDDIFEITNNGTFGSVMRLHSNGDISPVQQTQLKTNTKQHNKITNYLIGNCNQNVCLGLQDEAMPNNGGNAHMEVCTPSKRSQLSSTHNNNVKKSPKGKCSSTQITKLTKWFTKPSDYQTQIEGKLKSSNSKKSAMNQQFEQQTSVQNKNVPTTPPPTKRILKRRRLDLSFNK